MDSLEGTGRRRLTYGDHPAQTGDLHLPPDGSVPDRAVVLWHGGSFLADYGRAMLDPLARELARRGVVAYNVTYRRLGADGGVPETFDDALAAVDAIVAELGLTAPPAGIGLSAGAPLALHAAARGRLSRVVDIAGVAGLALVARTVGPRSGVWQLFGAGPDEAPAAYAEFDPMAQTLAVPVLVLHGDRDDVVPVALSRAYADHAKAELVIVPGAGHFDLHGRDAPAPPELLAFLGF